MPLQVGGASLAEKPNLQSLLRCRWPETAAFSASFVLRVASSVANALWYMHQHAIAHGDVYAHNVLADAQGNAVLCDYGARQYSLLLVSKINRILLALFDVNK
jgi:serine/threonine protein kinase